MKSLGIPLIEVGPPFNAHSDPLSLFPFRRFGHYNEEGNQIVANTIRKALANRDGVTGDNVIATSEYATVQ